MLIRSNYDANDGNDSLGCLTLHVSCLVVITKGAIVQQAIGNINNRVTDERGLGCLTLHVSCLVMITKGAIVQQANIYIYAWF